MDFKPISLCSMISLFTCGALLLMDFCYNAFCSSFLHPSEESNLLTCATFQTIYLIGCTYGYIQSTPHQMTGTVPYSIMNYVSHTIAGYFLYDLIFLYRLPKDRKQPIFVVHHLISLMIFAINQVAPTTPDRESFILMFLLEFTSPMINFWNFIRKLYPTSSYTRKLILIIKVSYAITRIIGLTAWLYWYISYATWKWNHIINASSFCCVYGASYYWFYRILLK